MSTSNRTIAIFSQQQNCSHMEYTIVRQHFNGERKRTILRCLELRIPPLPQLIKIGRAVWPPGLQHFERSFDVYDLIYVHRGVFYMTEDGEAHEFGNGELLTLEPGRTHRGHRPVETDAEIYWMHFIHPHPARRIDSDQVPWSSPVKRGTDADLQPTEQYMYIPKRARIEPSLLVPLMDEMVEMNNTLSLRSSLRLQAAAGELFSRLQAAASANVSSRAWRLNERAVRYLQDNRRKPFDSRDMEQQLHYQFDYVSRCMKQYTGMSPLQYLHHLQIEEAKSLLRHTDLAVQEIADRVGQPNANYFIRLFRRKAGLTPGAYRTLRRGSL